MSLTVATLLCALLTPATAWANEASGPACDEGSGVVKPGSTTMRVDALHDLEYTLSPADSLDQWLTPAVRVTITGTGWQLYAVWDGPHGTAAASIRECGVTDSWRRISTAPLLVASSVGLDERGKGKDKNKDKSRTTVLDLALLMHLGADGTDPWTVGPGTYTGRIKFVLRNTDGCDRDCPETESSMCSTLGPPTESAEPSAGADSVSLSASDTASAESALVSTDPVSPAGAIATPDATHSMVTSESEATESPDSHDASATADPAGAGSETIDSGGDETSAEATRTPAASDPPVADAPPAAPAEVDETNSDGGDGTATQANTDKPPSGEAKGEAPEKAKPAKAPPKPSEPDTESPEPEDPAASSAQ